MNTEMGEYLVGAYLKEVKDCDFVDYNVRPPGGGLKGLEELDVLGLDFKKKKAYLCEVTTHILGLLYVSNQETVERIAKKHDRQKAYAEEYLKEDFPDVIYMFWSPVVPRGYVTEGLAKIDELVSVINEGYTQCIDELRQAAKVKTGDTGNPAFRLLQILERLR